jgi:hypothetical protein
LHRTPGGEVAGRRIDNPKHLGGRGLLRLRLIAFGGALVQPLLRIGKLTLEFRNELLRII